jgi:hypothetical protein
MAKITLIGVTLQAPERKCLNTWDIVLELAVDPQDFLPLMQTFRIRNDKNKARIVALLRTLIVMRQSRSQPTLLPFLQTHDLQLFLHLFGSQEAVVKT